MGRPLNSRFFGPDDGVAAQLTVDVTGGTVDAVTIVDGGSGYAPSLTGETFLLATTAGGGDGAAEITYDTTAGGVLTNASVSVAGTTYDNGAGQAVTDVPTPAGEVGKQILGTAWIPGEGSAEPVYIVRQRSNRRYEVASVATPSTTGLVLTADTGTPAEGQFSIPVEPSDGGGGSTGTEYAKIIQDGVVKTFDGNRYAWGDLVIDESGEGGPGSEFPAE